MDAGSGFPIDLVLFGLIAAFLVLRLRSILGRRTGYERPPASYQPNPQAMGPIIEGKAESAAPVSARALPDPAGPAGQTLGRIRGIDRTFDPAGFLDGAEKAFRIIVGAFAAGDRGALRPLLSDDTYRAFDGAIAAREAAGQTQLSEVRAIQSATIETAELTGTTARLTVRFVSDQISLTRDASGHPVHGTDAVTELVDLWSFERDLTSRDPIWRLVAAASA
jgi:predicted lipid-binding transport protein (Tim44 family)